MQEIQVCLVHGSQYSITDSGEEQLSPKSQRQDNHYMCLCVCLYYIIYLFVFVDEINGDVEKEEEVVPDFPVHDSNI